MSLSSLFQQPPDSKIPMLISSIFIVSVFHCIFRATKSPVTIMDLSLSLGAAVEREGESRRLQGPGTPST